MTVLRQEQIVMIDEVIRAGRLSGRAGVLPRDAHRAGALLQECGVVDDQHRIRPADHLLRLLGEHALERLGAPATRADEVVDLRVVVGGHAGGQRLDALAVAGTEQPAHVDRTPRPPARVAQRRPEWREPAVELALPTRRAYLRPFARSSSRTPQPTTVDRGEQAEGQQRCG